MGNVRVESYRVRLMICMTTSKDLVGPFSGQTFDAVVWRPLVSELSPGLVMPIQLITRAKVAAIEQSAFTSYSLSANPYICFC